VQRDIIDILEAAYRVEQSEADWLEGVTTAFGRHVDRGFGLTGYLYDATDLEAVKLGEFWSDGRAVFGATREQVQAVVRHAEPEYVLRTWRGLPCSTVSQTPNIERQHGYAAMRSLGIHDILVVNAIDPTWHGVWLGACLPDVTQLESAEVDRWSRVAAHVASGFRVRRRLEVAERRDASRGAEAILDPGGTVLHAEPAAASQDARDALGGAAKAIERARSAKRRSLESSIDEWKGLIAARWTLVDHFESDGRRYLCARRNDAADDQARGLSEREYQVAAFLSLGHSTKLIAYELGITASTVRVLIARAIAKLGLTTRVELVHAFREGSFTMDPSAVSITEDDVVPSRR
jgi:DNA-binding CsgD family transcriptional regulator